MLKLRPQSGPWRMRMSGELSRRGLIGAGLAAGLTGGAAVAGGVNVPVALARGASAAGGRTRALRVAHLTDTHIQPELKADQGVVACLRHVHALPEKPDLIITGGDSIMDGFEKGEARTRLQWDLWTKTLRDECTIPVQSVLGNHDIWGWNKGKSQTRGDEAAWGKKWALDVFGVSSHHRSFDRNGWHIVLLDSVQPRGEGYVARLDDEQFEWLEGDLASTPATTPVVLFSHIPLLSAAPFDDARRADALGDYKISGGLVHSDFHRIAKLFLKHPNIRVACSGHLHINERVDYNGVTYLCNGAVSGSWWKGNHKQCRPGYGVLDLHADGTFAYFYMAYGWVAQE